MANKLSRCRWAVRGLVVWSALVSMALGIGRMEGTPPVHRARPVAPLRVLFVGNSYTYFNGGLGALVQSLASAVKGGRKLEYVEVTRSGQTLAGHWKEGKALAEIRKGGWDYVVLQEQSTLPLIDREAMYAAIRAFNTEIRKVGARTILFETWARKDRPETQSRLHQAYGAIAKELSATVAPAGMAWADVLKSKPAFPLHIADQSHPTPAGSYLNACVFFDVLFDGSPQGLPRTLRNATGKLLVDVSEADAAMLQHTAYTTCATERRETR